MRREIKGETIREENRPGKNRPGSGWLILAAVVMICGLQAASYGQISPQFGFDFFGGTNKLLSTNPWLGVRFSLSSKASFTFRYHHNHLSYEYLSYDGGSEPVSKKMRANISRFSSTLYAAGPKLSGYMNFSYLSGSDQYRGYLGDSGLEWKFHPQMAVLGSVYAIREKSVLWHPDETVRWINTYSARIGLKLWLVNGLAINPNYYLIRNSEDVKGSAYSVGLIYSPNWWLAITAYYFRYGETAFYIFHGNYFSFGLNFYF